MTIGRAFIRTAIWLVGIGVLLFGAAGSLAWPEAWALLALTGCASAALILWLARHDRTLLESRFSAPFHEDQQLWDRVFLGFVMIVYLSWMIVMGLDARRFGWSHMPAWLEGLGAAAIVACMFVTWRTFRVNSFAAPQVRTQSESGHRVVSEGPYRFVRHPMYGGALFYLVGVPLLLGSWWGLLMVPLIIGGLVMRIFGEEDMLRTELAGYDAYMSRVRYRLVPGVW